MSDESALLAREAKGLQQSLKELLKTRDAWDREIEFQRKRRQYLRLLFVHPYAPESKDVDNHLWMATSYQFISRYKERLTQLDRIIHGPPRQQQQQQASRSHNGQHRDVEYRKLLQRFRQFLAEEEKFWVQLIVRIRRVFALDDAQRALAALSIVPPEGTPTSPTAPDNGNARRNQHQFPSEADVVSPTAVAATAEQRQSKMAILSKALVCLGDIERYKEQYNETGNRPRAGHEDGPPAASGSGRGRGRRGGAAAAQSLMPRMRNYDKAQQCYEQARLLLPQDGNPSHQLAILATYQKDTFNSLVHYYRALCVRTPYETASENMGMTLGKALDAWRGKGENVAEKAEIDHSEPPRLRIKAFTEKLVILHALWRLPTEDAGIPLPDLSRTVVSDFKALVFKRDLPIDMISKVIILSQGALWNNRSARHSSANGAPGRRGPPVPAGTGTESSIATHLLALHRALLEVASEEIKEASLENTNDQDLAQRITATFRRTLPALRLAGKWIRGNTKYISQASSLLREQQIDTLGDTDTKSPNSRRRVRTRRVAKPPISILGVREFWESFVKFSNTLTRAFPFEKLPVLGSPLEEDMEMSGFLPLRALMVGDVLVGNSGRSATNVVAQVREEVHPNEEQLMRIRDILADTRALADAEETPFVFTDNEFMLRDDRLSDLETAPTTVDSPNHRIQMSRSGSPDPLVAEIAGGDPETLDLEDGSATETSRTEYDPVDAAFREVLEQSNESDEEEDEIVWNPRSSIQPQVSSPPLPHGTPRLVAPNSPPFQHRTPPVANKSLELTAGALLKELQGPSHSRVSSAPQALLFGSSPSGGHSSIWSTTSSSDPLNYSKPGLPLYQSQPSFGFSQGSSSYQNSQGRNVTLPRLPSPQTSSIWNGGHQRIGSLGRIQGLPSPGFSHQQQHYGSSTTFLPPADPSSSPFNNGVPSAYADPVYTASPHAMLQTQYPPGYHHPVHHSRIPSAETGLQVPMSSLTSASQLWLNPG
ncbi:uncharacterized protein FIBRA_07628 [Fibroporia radiculosa]|uniref:DNA/RNA-binding domain-containing protein n=1 Tax=Fibroporia radiculosa TaxID=599839 RepID=J4IBX3_9APHY|nr:uncharacterized protein FIBRA_07628 [Fibroporia radiculosa]CCM05411.1 predicted protein [Fibroporia radiculosa]